MSLAIKFGNGLSRQVKTVVIRTFGSQRGHSIGLGKGEQFNRGLESTCPTQVKPWDQCKVLYSTKGQWNPYYKAITDVDRIRAVDGNRSCSDCSNSDVQYISTINGGAYCTVCTGIHREVGVNSEFISLMDSKREFNIEDMQFYQAMGNMHVNNIYEASIDIVDGTKPTVVSSRSEMKDFIRQKYIHCSFSVARNDRTATENILNYVVNMRERGRHIPDLTVKVKEQVESCYDEVLEEAFEKQYTITRIECDSDELL